MKIKEKMHIYDANPRAVRYTMTFIRRIVRSLTRKSYRLTDARPGKICRLIRLSVCLSVAGFAAATPAPLEVVTVLAPHAWLAERIGGERIHVIVLLPPGASSETYEPTPRPVSLLMRADVYMVSSMPFERSWLTAARSVNPELQVVPCCTPSGDPDADRHEWTDPWRALELARSLRDALSSLDPAGASHYAHNFRMLETDVAALHEDVAARLAGLEGRSFAVSHPAWGAFAHRYGLRQINLETEGLETSARRLAFLIEQASATGTRYVFTQPQHSKRAARVMAEALDAELVELDPLAPDYLQNIRRTAERLAEALR